MRRAGKGTPRVFIGLLEVGGYYANLAAGLEAAGVPTTFADLGDHPFQYGGGSTHLLVDLARRVRRRRVEATGVAGVVWQATYRLVLVVLLSWALARHDVFIFGFRTTFLRLRDLVILRRLGKRVVMVFHGSDARPPYVDGADMDPAAGRSIGDCADLARTKKRDIETLERSAHVIVAFPLYGHFFTRPIVGFHDIGIPQPLIADFPAIVPEPPAPPLRVLHAPSNPFVKGSARIREVIAGLVAEGVPIELVELVGVPNSAVREELARCHFVVDQLYSDIPVTGLVAEAARYGRPSVLGGYGWGEIARLMPGLEWPPVEFCHPDELASAVRRLATDADHRRALGLAARRFAETWAAERVAGRFVELIEGRIPPGWVHTVDAVRYTHGVGLAEEHARAIVRGLIAEEGTSALQLDDRPAVRDAFVAFAPPVDRGG
ncbi:MAG: hypothetical protein ACXWWQ_03320 [Candidatus Limnocylindria bacterium]